MNLPAEMKYIEITEPGAPGVLQPRRTALPQIQPGDVLIEIEAAGVNRPDVVQRQGTYPPPPGASPIPGLEVAGTVVARGESVTRFDIDDKVCALVNGGGYAQYVAVPATQCLPVPAGLSMLEAAALPETVFTVWTNVFDRGALQDGETFLVHGGSSGIGTIAIQIAHARGAKVFTTAGNAEKCSVCESLGAHLAVNYKDQDFVEVLLDATDGKGIDVILDMVGGDYVPRNLKLAAREGRVVIIATLRGSTAEIDIRSFLMKSVNLTGSVLRPRTVEQKAAIANAVHENVWPLVESGQVRPIIHSTFPLDDAASAHALMESSEHIGKIVLEVNGNG
jgi:NADPH2:quinone reductase